MPSQVSDRPLFSNVTTAWSMRLMRLLSPLTVTSLYSSWNPSSMHPSATEPVNAPETETILLLMRMTFTSTVSTLLERIFTEPLAMVLGKVTV